MYRQFEIPLLSALDEYKLLTADRLASYEKSLSDQSAKIRKTEAQNLRDGRRRKRDLNAFRAALAELQRQVEELDGIKMGYHEEVLEGEGEVCPLPSLGNESPNVCGSKRQRRVQKLIDADMGYSLGQSRLCRPLSARLL